MAGALLLSFLLHPPPPLPCCVDAHGDGDAEVQSAEQGEHRGCCSTLDCALPGQQQVVRTCRGGGGIYFLAARGAPRRAGHRYTREQRCSQDCVYCVLSPDTQGSLYTHPSQPVLSPQYPPPSSKRCSTQHCQQPPSSTSHCQVSPNSPLRLHSHVALSHHAHISRPTLRTFLCAALHCTRRPCCTTPLPCDTVRVQRALLAAP